MRRVAAIESNPRSRFWYLEVPKAVSGELAALGAELARDAGGKGDDADHVTLAFVPKATEFLDEEDIAGALEAVGRALRGFSPLDVWVGGIAYFDTATKDKEPATALVALVDGPGLDILHSTVAAALRDHGWEWEDRHSYTAHVTLAYLPVGARVSDLPVIDQGWAVDEVCFSNVEVHRLPLDTRHAGAAREGRRLGGGHVGRVVEAVLSQEQLYEAIGEASACWDNLEGAGVFDSQRAAGIAERLFEDQFQKGAVYTGFHGQVWEADRRDETGKIHTFAFDVPTLQAWAERNARVDYIKISALDLDPEQSDPEDWDARLDMADLIYPILVVDVDGDLVIMDGVHRAYKAQKMGKDKIRARVISWDDLFLTGAEREPEGPEGDEPMNDPDDVFAPEPEQPVQAARRIPMIRVAELHDEDLRRFRTEPDVGNGRLYPYCSDCVNVTRASITGVVGCRIGDRQDVVTHSRDVDMGKVKIEQARCPGYESKTSAGNDGDGSSTIRQARLITGADAEAGMFKDVPAEDVSFDDDVQPENADVTDLDELYNYLEVVGIDPASPNHVGLDSVTRAISSWRGGQLQEALRLDPDLPRRVWEGFSAGAALPPEAPPDELGLLDDDGIEVDLFAPEPEAAPEEHQVDGDHYIWRTARDGRVRPEHARREGRIFAWDDPPWDGHPGSAPGCRCSSEAVVELPGRRAAGRSRVCRRCGGVRRSVDTISP